MKKQWDLNSQPIRACGCQAAWVVDLCLNSIKLWDWFQILLIFLWNCQAKNVHCQRTQKKAEKGEQNDFSCAALAAQINMLWEKNQVCHYLVFST